MMKMAVSGTISMKGELRFRPAKIVNFIRLGARRF